MKTLARIAGNLLQGFSRQRPMRAGSLIVTLFGDSIATRHTEVAIADLIDVLGPFGITHRLARTSIGRLAKENWLQARRVGRSSFYRLTSDGEERFAEATARIYGAPREEWRGEWTLVILTNSLQARQLHARQREAVRKELAWMGFGQWSQSTFAHPEAAAQEAQRHLQRLKLHTKAVVLQTRSTGVDADRQLVALGWDLRELERRYRRFIRTFEPAFDAVEKSSGTPRECFHVRTLLIHEYRRVHLRDPLLPALLLPAGWAGTAAYGLCRDLYRRLAAKSDEYLASRLHGAAGALPPPSAAYLHRFAPEPHSIGQDCKRSTKTLKN